MRGTSNPKLLRVSLALGMTQGEAPSDKESHCHPQTVLVYEILTVCLSRPYRPVVANPKKSSQRRWKPTLYIVWEIVKM